MNTVTATHMGHVGILRLNRPPDNYFDTVMINEIAGAFEGFVGAGMRSIVLCAEGRNFCAGANFQRQQPSGSGAGALDADNLYRHAVRLFRCPLPIVAAVSGAAIGGGLGLAMVADFRVASPETRFSANFSRLGFHPGFGLSVTLPRAIGEQNATLLFYTGRRIDGREAHRIGLADVLVSKEELFGRALNLATEIAQSSPIAVQSVRATLRVGLADRIAAATEHELAEQEKHFATEDFKEGVAAMAERRLPNFRGAPERTASDAGKEPA